MVKFKERKKGDEHDFQRRPTHWIKGKTQERNHCQRYRRLLNTCDGTIYVGVKDDGIIVGIDNLDKASLMISNIVSDQIEPNPRGLVSIETPTIDDKTIIRITVRKGDKLYYVKKYGMSSVGCFERIGTSARGMTTEQIAR